MEDVEEAEEAEEVPLTLQRSRMIVWVARLGEGEAEGESGQIQYLQLPGWGHCRWEHPHCNLGYHR